MIMKWRKAHFDAFRLALYITVKRLYVKSTGYYQFVPYSGSRPSYIILNSP